MNPSDIPNTPPQSQPKSGMAITSMVLGIASFALCLGFLSAIPAIITGHIAYNRAKKFPGQFAGGGMAMAGFILGYVALVFSLLILPAMLMPAFAKAKEKAQTIQCMNNLKQIGMATRLYASEHQHVYPSDFKSIEQELGSPKVLRCPADKTKTTATSFSTLSGDNISYEIVNPGMSDSDASQVYARCPIHGSELRGDGAVMRRPRGQ
jgi:hypothetical protein